MTTITTFPTDLTLIMWDTLGGIIKNLPIFILIIWGVRVLAKEIKGGIKEIPNWLNQYDDIRTKHYHIQKALENRR